MLAVPEISKITIGGRAFKSQARQLWNLLPASVCGADTLCKFKTRLKTFLYDRAYG